MVAEAVSKRYGGVPVPLYQPMVSIFDRGVFGRRRGRLATADPAGDESTPTDEDGSAAEASTRQASTDDERRRSSEYEREDLDGDYDDEGGDDDDEFDDDEGLPTTTLRLEPFWALKDVSFSVAPGTSLGILGDQGSGKSTLLRILAGATRPTSGRALVRGVTSPPPNELAKGLGYTARGTFHFNLNLGCRMLGINPRLVSPHRREIEDLAPMVLRPDGAPDAGSMDRMAVAIAVVVPSNVILLEDGRSWEGEFTEQIVERAKERVRGGSTLIFASRNAELVREMCDQVIVLHEGEIVDRGGTKGVIRRHSVKGEGEGKAKAPRFASSERLSQGRKLRVPPVVPAFNAAAALISATLTTDGGRPKRIDHAAEVIVEIRLDTAIPDVEVQCGIGFMPREADRTTGVRVDLPEPIRLVEPGSYTVVARTAPGTLRSGAYGVRADAIVANPDERVAGVIARDIGRVRVAAGKGEPPEPVEPPLEHWDGSVSWQGEAQWSIE